MVADMHSPDGPEGFLRDALRRTRQPPPKSKPNGRHLGDPPPAGDAKPAAPPRTISARELIHKPMPPLRWTWREFLPEGLAVLGGPPKLGKSWLCYQLALSVAGGADLFGQDTAASDVLMLALEDGERRAQSRLGRLAMGAPERLHFAYEWPRMDKGGAEEIERWCQGRKHPLVLVDTLQKLRPPGVRGANAYEADYAFTAELHRLAHRLGITLLAVLHMRKGGANDADWLEGISGSVGNVSAADTILALKRPRGDASAFIHVTGRDVAEAELALRFDGGRWSCLGDAAQVRMTERERAILAAMAAAGPAGISPAELAALVPDLTRNNAKQTLRRMAERGTARSLPGGRYACP